VVNLTQCSGNVEPQKFRQFHCRGQSRNGINAGFGCRPQRANAQTSDDKAGERAMMYFLGRLFLVPLGFILATLVTIFVMVTLGSERITHAIQGQNDVPLTAAFELVGQAAILTSAMTIVPALALIIIGEVARIRSLIYYVVGGGLALVALPALAQAGFGSQLQMPSAAVWQVFATSGFLGGFTYWLIAGRTV